MATPERAALFVYGTLMPGRLRWPLIAGEVIARRPGSIRGALLDTGRGYPTLVLDGSGAVHGWVLDLDPARLRVVWRHLDQVEGPEYERVTTTTSDGGPAQTYVFTGDPDGFTALTDGRWPEGNES